MDGRAEVLAAIVEQLFDVDELVVDGNRFGQIADFGVLVLAADGVVFAFFVKEVVQGALRLRLLRLGLFRNGLFRGCCGLRGSGRANPMRSYASG